MTPSKTTPAEEQPATPSTATARTMSALVLDAAAKYRGTALKYPLAKGWGTISYPKLGDGVREIAKGLIALGVKPGDRVAILSNTRAEWTLADFGAICAGAVVVPVYQTNSPDECLYVLEHSGATAIFCEDEEQVAKLDEIRSRAAQAAARHPLRGRERGRADAVGAEGARRGRHRRAVRRARARRHRGRRRDDRLHVRHDRPAEGLHAHARQPARRPRRDRRRS